MGAMRNGQLRSKLLRMAVLFAFGFSSGACTAEEPSGNSGGPVQSVASQEENVVQISIKAGETVLTARLEDSAPARDFAAMLPLRLSLEDYASTEKVADLPRKLSTQGAPAGVDPAVGDIAFYAPWGNLAIYYRDFGHSRGLVRLGRIESGVEGLATLEGPVTIEAAERNSQ